MPRLWNMPFSLLILQKILKRKKSGQKILQLLQKDRDLFLPPKERNLAAHRRYRCLRVCGFTYNIPFGKTFYFLLERQIFLKDSKTPEKKPGNRPRRVPPRHPIRNGEICRLYMRFDRTEQAQDSLVIKCRGDTLHYKNQDSLMYSGTEYKDITYERFKTYL